MMSSRCSFVFEDWKELAESDPEAFEKARESVIQDAIERASIAHRQRLSRLQWRLDRERDLSTNPLSACVKMSKMMLNSVYGKDGLVDALNGETRRNKKKAAYESNVVTFRVPQ